MSFTDVTIAGYPSDERDPCVIPEGFQGCKYQVQVGGKVQADPAEFAPEYTTEEKDAGEQNTPAVPAVTKNTPPTLDVEIFEGVVIAGGDELITDWIYPTTAEQRGTGNNDWDFDNSEETIGGFTDVTLDEESTGLFLRGLDFSALPKGAAMTGIEIEVETTTFGGAPVSDELSLTTCGYEDVPTTQDGSVLVASVTDHDEFGVGIALNAAGTKMVAAAALYPSSPGKGRIFTYNWSGSVWNIAGSATLDPPALNWVYGGSLQLSDDGLVMLTTSQYWDATPGVYKAGVDTYDWSGGAWVQRGSTLFLSDAENTYSQNFADFIALSGDGELLVVGASGWDWRVGGALKTAPGMIATFTRSGSTWIQSGDLLFNDKSDELNYFGSAVAMNSAGTIMATTASDGLRIYSRSGSAWVGGTVEDATPSYVDRLAISGDGTIMAIGYVYDDTYGTDAGQVILYDMTGASITQREAGIIADPLLTYDNFGRAIALDTTGAVMVVGGKKGTVGANRGGVHTFFPAVADPLPAGYTGTITSIPTEGHSIDAKIYACTDNSAAAPYIFSDYVIGQRLVRTYGGSGYTFGLGDFVDSALVRKLGMGILLKLTAPAAVASRVVVHSTRMRVHYLKNAPDTETLVIPEKYPADLAAVAISPVTGTQIVVGRAGKILRSTDNGQNWSAISSGTHLDFLAITNKGMEGTVFVATGQNGFVYESTDDGVSWSSAESSSRSSMHVVFYSTDKGYILSGVNKRTMRATRDFSTWVIPEGLF